MLGDFRGTTKSIQLLKATAGFYMVYLHGMTLFSMNLGYVDFTHIHPAMKVFSVFKTSFALFLPAFAGYYLRGEVGPYLQNYRLNPRFIKLGFQFFALAVGLEAARLLAVTGNPAFIFNWNALHFIAVAMTVTYVLLWIDSRILLPFVLALIAAQFFREHSAVELFVTKESLSEPYRSVVIGLWLITLFALLLWVSRSSKMLLRLTLPLSVLACATITALAAGFIASSDRAIISFANIPASIFFANNFDDNYWPFVLCYPTFAFGYFLRSVLFDVRYRRLVQLMNVTAAVALVMYFWLLFPRIIARQVSTTTFSKLDFMAQDGLLSALVLVYVCFIAYYYLFARRKTAILDKWSYFSRSILILYLIHGPVLKLAIWIFPLYYVEQFKGSVHSTLWFVEFFVLGAYAICLYLSHRIVRIFEFKQEMV